MQTEGSPVLAGLLLAILVLAGPAWAATASDPGEQGPSGRTQDGGIGDHGWPGAVDLRAMQTGTGSSALQWQRCFGGTAWDSAFSIDTTADGGAIVAAASASTDGDASGNPGTPSPWVLRLDAVGVRQWQKFLDIAGYIGGGVQQTDDGGFIVTGSADTDLWALKLDAAGTLQWQDYLGGGGYEMARSVQQTADGGYILAGDTSSHDGDVAGQHGGGDAWIVKLDPAGALQWQRCLGGTASDTASCVRQTSDGGYVAAGYTYSDDGDFAGSHGSSDAWVAKLDAAGTLVWRRCLGGSSSESASAVRQTADHGYIVVGETGSSDGDVAGNHGPWQSDAWVVKLTPAGGLSWQRCLGGTARDEATGVEQMAEGRYVVSGSTFSDDGDVSGNHGGYDESYSYGYSDVWIVTLDAGGAPIRQECLGGTGMDVASALDAAGDGGFLLTGWTSSDDGDVTGYHWGLDLDGERTADVWVVRLTAAVGLQAIFGGVGLPTDADGDGRYEDVNGNGRRDFADVVLYSKSMRWIAQNEPVECFDYNTNGRIDFADVVWLFNNL